MCKRLRNEKGEPLESWGRFVLRWALETVSIRPSAFITVFACCGMGYMYYSTTADARENRDKFLELLDRQTQVMVEVSKQLTELNTRVQFLEKK